MSYGGKRRREMGCYKYWKWKNGVEIKWLKKKKVNKRKMAESLANLSIEELENMKKT